MGESSKCDVCEEVDETTGIGYDSYGNKWNVCDECWDGPQFQGKSGGWDGSPFQKKD